MTKSTLLLLSAVGILAALPLAAELPQEPIGSITNIAGAAHVLRAEQELVAEKGLRLFAADVLRTGAGGGIGVVLRDDTTLSLGPNSELTLSDFDFKPDEGILGMTLKMIKGTLVYISGQIAKLAPGSAKVETPAGIAAVRGTKLPIEVPETKPMKREGKSK